ncbi:hypothetical protein H257_14675 [Aphanomyces astaci]|uniref:Myb/SANT-like domain-containing protein n=1 Tax=Aphanomyces astaci TaxID=112090 RepID=W4FQ96_APHAT|nr:hypothetical protein H257_14675 [Aphanomyces astaci]ETV69652.1 hypothetical protein H257_14675 [Aphanomyces astaci]|eukprot:XP_009840868.1 hypothetical protein H257_14675 [Aphanomyces astaci]
MTELGQPEVAAEYGPTAKKPRTFKPTIKTSPVDKMRATSTREMIADLMAIRFSETAKRKFNACKTTKQKAAWWAFVTARFNIRAGVNYDVKQVTKRFAALKTEYRSLCKLPTRLATWRNQSTTQTTGRYLWNIFRNSSPMMDSIQDNFDETLGDSDDGTNSPLSTATKIRPAAHSPMIPRAVVAIKSLGDSLEATLSRIADALVTMASSKTSPLFAPFTERQDILLLTQISVEMLFLARRGKIMDV